jgi:glycosyltransferase involved in cell wall biosynthesis
VTDGAGLLVPPRDPRGLAAALERLRDPALRSELADGGRARVEAEFDVERIAAELAARFAAC